MLKGCLTCEVCGKRATQMVQDTEPEHKEIGILGKKPNSPPHFFCDEHTREPIERSVE